MKAHERMRGLLRTPRLLYQLAGKGSYEFVYDQMPIELQGMPWAKRINLIRAGLNLVRRRADPWSKPLHMQIELVNYCQLKCPVCPTGTGGLLRPAKRMDPALFRSLMQDTGPGLLSMSLWAWGESLLHPQLPEFLKEARRYNAAVFLSTNGQNLDQERVLEAILEYPPTFLIVAIDGLTDATNSLFRVGARLEPAIRGVEKIARARKGRLPILHMRYIVMRHNQHELEHVEKFAAENHFDLLSLRQLVTGVTEAEVNNFRALCPENPGSEAAHEETGVFPDSFVCMQPYWFPTVLADGTVVACEQDFNGTEPLGRIGGGRTFSDVWCSSGATGVRKKLRDHPESASFCRACTACDRTTTDASLKAFWLNGETGRPVSPGG